MIQKAYVSQVIFANLWIKKSTVVEGLNQLAGGAKVIVGSPRVGPAHVVST